MTKEFIKIRRVECLPASVKNDLKEKGILGGLVEIKISESSPKTVEDITQSLELFSQKLEEANTE